MSMNSFHARQGRPRHAAASKGPVDRHGLARADQLLVTLGLAPSRAVARELIEAGRVQADGKPVTKPAHELPHNAHVVVQGELRERFVSRGGIKLAGALARTGLDVRGAVCLDVGQSTGGFTDCLLQAGAARVVGVEVGHGQLHADLCHEPRCVTLEGLNARHLRADDLGEHFPDGGFDLIVCDASFISLALLLPQWRNLLAPNGHILALVKPQFEVGPDGVGKGGIVRDASLYAEVETRLRAAAHDAGFLILDWFDSPITGGDGNREFFFHGVRTAAAAHPHGHSS